MISSPVLATSGMCPRCCTNQRAAEQVQGLPSSQSDSLHKPILCQAGKPDTMTVKLASPKYTGKQMGIIAANASGQGSAFWGKMGDILFGLRFGLSKVGLSEKGWRRLVLAGAGRDEHCS